MDTYQQPSTIDWTLLEVTLQFRFRTSEGLFLAKWAGIVAKLRPLVHAALMDTRRAIWQKVTLVVHVGVCKFRVVHFASCLYV